MNSEYDLEQFFVDKKKKKGPATKAPKEESKKEQTLDASASYEVIPTKEKTEEKKNGVKDIGTDKKEAVVPKNKKIVCRKFLEGKCRFGLMCKFLHPEPEAEVKPKKSAAVKKRKEEKKVTSTVTPTIIPTEFNGWDSLSLKVPEQKVFKYAQMSHDHDLNQLN